MKKRKGELPSGNIRRQVFVGYEYQVGEDGRYIYDENGKRVQKRKYVSVTGETVKEVERKKAELLAGVKKQTVDYTLREAIERYIDTSEALLSPSTIKGYDVILRCAFTDIMDMKISDLTNDVLRQAVNKECQRPKQKGGKPISSKTVINEWGLISTVIKFYAPEIDIKVKMPQKEVKQNDISDAETLFNVFKGTDMELPVLLAMWLSFTVSEILGLTKSKSISQDGKYISIKEVKVIDKYGAYVTKTKGKQPTRNRTLRLPEYIKELIDEVPGDQIVPITGACLKRRFDTAIRHAGLPHMTFHDLRHVNASVMLSIGINNKQAQARGGWKSDKVLTSHYQQIFSSEREKADDKIDGFFEKIIDMEEVFDRKKYAAWLILYDLEDNEKNKKEFLSFMQHECNTNSV